MLMLPQSIQPHIGALNTQENKSVALATWLASLTGGRRGGGGVAWDVSIAVAATSRMARIRMHTSQKRPPPN